jgi:hypothetical protein
MIAFLLLFCASPALAQLPVEIDARTGKPITRGFPVEVTKDGKARIKLPPDNFAKRESLPPNDGFEQQVERILEKGRQAAEDDHEAGDLRILAWLLRDYRKHIAAGDGKSAWEARYKMDAALQRSAAVAADGPRRAEAATKATEERRHKEEMRQRERQHQERLKQQERQYRDFINRLDALRARR